MMGPITDIHNLTTAQPLMASTAITAAGGGDNTKVTGLTIDRGVNNAKALKAMIRCTAVLAAGKKLTIAAEYQTSSDNSSWDTAVVMQAATTALIDAASGGTYQGVVELGLNLLNLKRYVRINVTPDLDASGTDTAIINGVALLAGHDVIPASAA
jgi:hypothetical protein